MATTSTTPIITKYNETDYEVEIYIDDNTAPSITNRFNINPNGIVNLNIEDTLADWVVRGTITIYYAFESAENRPTTLGALQNTDGSFYYFRNDGNDILHIKMYPSGLKRADLKLDRKHWELSYKFSIYDVEDIDDPPGAQNAASASIKCKKFYFWDRWYQQMITDTMEYSTALSQNVSQQFSPAGGSAQTGLSDEFRSIPTGIAIKEIIEKTLTQNKIYFDLTYQTNIVGGGEKSAWDPGASNIFYTAPAGASAYDSLMYVYSRHVSSRGKNIWGPSTGRGGSIAGSINDFCVLYKERGPQAGDEGFFALRPMSDFFDKAGNTTAKDFQIERFNVQNVTPETSKIRLTPSYKPTTGSAEKDLQLGAYSIISKYKFVDMSPYINATKFRTTPVHSFDFNTRTYKVEFTNNSITTAKDFITKEYISKLYKIRGEPDRLFLPTIDNAKQSRNIHPVYSLSNIALNRQADGLQKLLKTGIFQSTAINFRVLGLTNREPGRFIIIDEPIGIDDTPFNNKLYGQWFIINVRHIFEAGLYYNDITAVKIHSLQPPPV
jgi:hypothetical protein